MRTSSAKANWTSAPTGICSTTRSPADEVLTVIDRRIQRRLADHPTGIYRSIADQIEKLRQMAITRAEDSVEFLRKALELARAAVEADRL